MHAGDVINIQRIAEILVVGPRPFLSDDKPIEPAGYFNNENSNRAYTTPLFAGIQVYARTCVYMYVCVSSECHILYHRYNTRYIRSVGVEFDFRKSLLPSAVSLSVNHHRYTAVSIARRRRRQRQYDRIRYRDGRGGGGIEGAGCKRNIILYRTHISGRETRVVETRGAGECVCCCARTRLYNITVGCDEKSTGGW